ncbi:hypothetical protein FGO68_gene11697 [Halteria grandinella]|uniref:TLDc domain-containing protein n=1 Tax=Halteria grandinella TaxID=5974 RepID=A0A8J8NMB5_HALGN|nr:hypothetical protein FGO68_gene11697 [Halteria grandinella]
MLKQINKVCPGCSKDYNLANRAPILHSCCGKSTCKECWLQQFAINGRFYCYHFCGESNTEEASKPTVNMQIRREIQDTVPLEIFCDKHHERITGYSLDNKSMLCPKCPKIHDKRKYHALDFVTVEKCCSKLLLLMEKRVEELQDSIDTMYKYVRQEIAPYGTQFVTLLGKCHGFVQDQVKTVEDKRTLFFLNNFKLDTEETLKEVETMFQKQSVMLGQANKHLIELIKGKLGRRFKMQLLMRGSEDGFTADKFHRLCDQKGPTLTVIQTLGSMIDPVRTFGGYTSLSWKSPQYPQDLPDPDAFLFSLDHKSLHPVKQTYNAVTHRKDYLAIFGQGYDVSMAGRCNENNISKSYFGCCYEMPELMVAGSEEAKCYMAGTYNYKVKDFEVFQIIYLE